MSFFSMPLVSGSIVCAKDDDGNLASKIKKLQWALDDADAVIVGAGAGLSTAAGLTYSGARFNEHFADFRDAFGITDMYSGGFYPFPDMETFWAWWSRHIYCNRYDEFCRRHESMRVMYLELGVGMNTPVVIKYPFWNAVDKNGQAIYACVNLDEACAPGAISNRSILIDGDVGKVLSACIS